MLKTRAYSRKELESLRRADLQNLYKASHLSNPPIHVHFPFPLIVIHGLKGANQKSDVLLENLVSFFASPAFRLSPPASPSRTHAARRLKSIEVQTAPKHPPRPASAPNFSLARRPASAQGTRVGKGAPGGAVGVAPLPSRGVGLARTGSTESGSGSGNGNGNGVGAGAGAGAGVSAAVPRGGAESSVNKGFERIMAVGPEPVENVVIPAVDTIIEETEIEIDTEPSSDRPPGAIVSSSRIPSKPDIYRNFHAHTNVLVVVPVPTTPTQHFGSSAAVPLTPTTALVTQLRSLSDRMDSLERSRAEPSNLTPASTSTAETLPELHLLREEIRLVRSAVDGGRGRTSQPTGTGPTGPTGDAVDELAVMEMLEARDRQWADKLRRAEDGWRRKLRQVEEDFNEKIEAMETWLRKYHRAIKHLAESDEGEAGRGALRDGSGVTARELPQVTVTGESSTSGTATASPSATALGKRRERNDDGVEERRSTFDPPAGAEDAQAHDNGASPRKRARRDLVIEAARRSASPSKSPRTPSPTKLGSGGGSSIFKTPELPASALKSFPPPPPGAPTGAFAESTLDPRTPSPAHQGIQPDMSRTPVINPDFFSHGPTFATSSGSLRRRSLSDTEGLPFPFFATTPKPPGEPRSPTLDAPPSASRGRVAKALVPPILTPGRPKWQKGHARRPSDPTPRAVSQAHMELSTITEASPEGHLTAGLGLEVITQQSDSAGSAGSAGIGFPSAPRINFPSDQPTTTSLVTDLLGPALSGTRSRGGTSTPPCLSPSPSITESHSRFIPSASGYPSRQARTVSAVSAASAVCAVTDVSAAPTDRTDRSSPAREFMDVALHGLPNPTESPSGIATPGHRTMLGTERYRDTRFGDIPVVNWGTPSVDYGFGSTPKQPARANEA